MKAVEQMSDAKGTIQAIDLDGRKLTIEGLVLKKTFDVAGDAMIATEDKSKASLADLKVGDTVEILYKEAGPASIAHCIAHPGAVALPKLQELKKAA